jgi:hypothetical protein
VARRYAAAVKVKTIFDDRDKPSGVPGA